MDVSTKTTRTPPAGICRHGQRLGECSECARTIRKIARAHQTLHARNANGKEHRIDSAHDGNGKPPKRWAPSVPVADDLCSGGADTPEAFFLKLGLRKDSRSFVLACVIASMPGHSFTKSALVVAAFRANPLFALDGFPEYADSHRVHEVLCTKNGLVARGVVTGAGDEWCKGPNCPVVEK